MPSRANPNTPTALKRKSAAQLKSKRKHTQRKVLRSKITKSIPKSSSATMTAKTSPNTDGTATTTVESGRRVTGTSQAIRKENARRRRLEQAVKREKADVKRGKRDGEGEAMAVEVENGEVEKGEGEEEAGMDVD